MPIGKLEAIPALLVKPPQRVLVHIKFGVFGEVIGQGANKLPRFANFCLCEPASTSKLI
jgi:hypothetical protein